MKLINNKYGFAFEFDYNIVQELVCESPSIYNDLICELYNANNNINSSFVLSNEGTIMDFSKKCEIIINPFVLDINNKKNIDKLYALFASRMNYDNLYIRRNELLLSISEYINIVSYDLDFCVNYINDVDSKGLLKLFDVKIDEECAGLVELVDNYMLMSNKLQGEKIYLFVNLKAYLTEQQLASLYKSILYNKYNVILLENVDRGLINNENKVIIDKDGCIIS